MTHLRGLARRWRREVVAVGAGAGLALACTFHPPPPLPEELAEQQAEQAARREAVRGGQPVDPADATDPAADPSADGAQGTPDGASGEPEAFEPGEQADVGMTPEQMQAYARSQGDPRGGVFPLSDALEGLEGSGRLWVEMTTTQGVIACELFEDQTPITVANFVGLARGLRPALDLDQKTWTTRKYYDGAAFHRVIPGFVIQGGDPTGSGRGSTGYVIPDEFVAGVLHDEAGKLSMANRGPGTGSAQFFITLAPLPHLDGKHTVFGQCDEAGIEVAEKIAAMRGPGDRPRTPQLIESMKIVRR